MNEFTVTNKQELMAAIRAAAMPSHWEARANPVKIELLGTSCRYLFPDGIQESRAEAICRRINKTPAGAFRP